MRTPRQHTEPLPSSQTWDWTAYLDGLVDYIRLEPQPDVEVELSGSLAVVRYGSLIDVRTPHGGGHLGCWYLDLYVRDSSDRWRWGWAHTTDTIAA